MNKEFRRERTKREFILASKQIIESSGIDQVSARKVGEISGYSYATIYNYFKDINTLLTYVSIDYLNDSYNYTITGAETISDLTNKLIHYAKRYITYMIKNPSIFKLIFINDYGASIDDVKSELAPKVAIKLRETLNQMDQSRFRLSYDVTFQLIASSIHSKILFYITKRGTDTKDELFKQIEREIKEVTNQ